MPSRDAAFVADPDFTLYVGDVRDVLPGLADDSIDCCVTSPPYWRLRDYGTDGQLGLERTPDEYVSSLVDVFRDVRRLLRPRGTLWLNLGDSYNAYNGNRGTESTYAGDREAREPSFPTGHGLAAPGLKPKDLVGIPWRVALALQADGWTLRSDIVWAKPNPMPESVTDRPTKAHEYVFLLTKSPRYFYDSPAIAEPATWYGPNGKPKAGPHSGQMEARAGAKRPQQRRAAQLAAQHGLTEQHFEAMRAVGISDAGKAIELRERGDWGGTSHSADTQRLVDEAKEALGGYYREFLIPLTRNARSVWEIQTMQYAEAHFATFPEELPRRCIAAGCPAGGTVLDPFMGSGTTALVARKLGRRSIGVELNPEYAELAARRLAQQSLLADEAVA